MEQFKFINFNGLGFAKYGDGERAKTGNRSVFCLNPRIVASVDIGVDSLLINTILEPKKIVVTDPQEVASVLNQLNQNSCFVLVPEFFSLPSDSTGYPSVINRALVDDIAVTDRGIYIRGAVADNSYERSKIDVKSVDLVKNGYSRGSNLLLHCQEVLGIDLGAKAFSQRKAVRVVSRNKGDAKLVQPLGT